MNLRNYRVGIIVACCTCFLIAANKSYATASITTPATANVSADTSTGTYVTLSGPVLTEGANRDIGLGTIILNAPAGFQFDPTALVTATVTRAGGNGNATLLTLSAGVAVVTTSTITITVASLETSGSVRSRITWSGIRVRATAGAPLASGNITRSGIATIAGITTSTSFGLLTEVGGAVRSLVFTTQPAAAVAGAAFGTQPLIRTRDQFGNIASAGLPATSFVTIALSAGAGPLQGTTSLNIGTGGGNGTATFTNLRIDAAGNNKQLTVTSTNGLTAALSSTFTVSPAVANKLVIGTQPSAAGVAGVPFAQQPVLLIEDAFNNVRTSDTLAVTATRAGGTGTLLGTTTVNAVNGAAAFGNLAHPVATPITLAFTSGALTGVTSAPVVISPASFSQLLVLLPGQTSAPGTVTGRTGNPLVTAGASTPIQVNAVDAFFNAVGNITDTIHLSTTDPNAVVPPNTPLANGAATLNLTFKTAGLQSVTASDATDATKTANADQTSVNAGPFVKLQALAPGETPAPGSPTGKTGTPIAQGAGTPFSVAVNSVDANWNRVSTNDTVQFNSTDLGATLPANAPLTNGTGTFSLTLGTAGSQTITVSDVTRPTVLPGTTALISVSGGKLSQTITFGPLNNVVYGVAPITLNATASSGLPVSFSVVSGPATVAGNVLTVTGAGNITVRASQAGNATYNPAANVDQSFTSSQAVLTATADNKVRAFGTANPPLTASYTGFVNNDTTNVLSGAPALSTAATISSPAGVYPISISQGTLVAPNYSFAFVFGTLTITNVPVQSGPTTLKPMVAIHDSELTRALETIPASGSTPTGPGTTGFQWWSTDWHYFVMANALKEALRSDGTAFAVVSDADISNGKLLDANGSPVYPIVISLSSEAVRDDEIAQFTNYVAAGGFLMVGGSSFTRQPTGTPRGDFAFANAMGVHTTTASLANWVDNSTFTKSINHRLLNHIPAGTLTWQMPSSSEEVSWPVPYHLTAQSPPGLPHSVWQVRSADAQVIAQADAQPYITVKSYGKGTFIYDASMQPLIGHGGWSPGMYAYGIFRKAIEWAFESVRLSVPKVSPWPYSYDAAVIFRHDMEAIPARINSIEASAQFENANGARGDYYFCTGTLRLDMPGSSGSDALASLQRAVNLYGATVGPHNGGLTNINPVYNPRLVLIEPNLTQLLREGWITDFSPYTPPLSPLIDNDYDYWHWGPDEVLDVTGTALPPGYANGRAYAFTSLSNSFVDIAGWGLANGAPKTWVCPFFNATREGSYIIQDALGVKATGDDKLTPFPHWIFSTQTPDRYYSTLSLPVSDWFVGSAVAQSMENGHNSSTIQQLVDYYYNLGALINLYSHSSSDGSGPDGTLPTGYLTYSLSKPRVWSANTVGIYNWWLSRTNVQIAPTFTNNAGVYTTKLTISGATDPQTAVEVVLPNQISSGLGNLAVLLNGQPANANNYRVNGQTIKMLVGTSVTTAEIRYTVGPAAQDDFYALTQSTTLNVAAPGVLANDSDPGGSQLTAILVSGTSHGTLSLSANGAFTYTPTGNYSGPDSFTYKANNGASSGNTATVTLTITPAGALFFDGFTRNTDPGPISPWTLVDGTWSVSAGMLNGTGASQSYAHVYVGNSSWTNYSVQGQFQYTSTSGWGGGIGARLNSANGAHYAAWVYPDNSPAGSDLLVLFKFSSWTSYTEIQQVGIPAVGTGGHILKLTLQGNRILVFYDGNQMMDITDDGSFDGQAAYLSGGITEEMWIDTVPYSILADNVLVDLEPVSANDAYTAQLNTTLTVNSPGVLANDADAAGRPLTAALVTGPLHGTLTLNANGSFVYTPAANYSGPDSFTYRANDGIVNGNVATVNLSVVASGPVTLFSDNFTRATDPGPLAPWVVQSGTWTVTGGVMQGSGASQSYSYAYFNTNWTDYTLSGQVRFSSTSQWGAGLGGRLNSATGAHYGAWVYPESSGGGSSTLKLIKFSSYSSWTLMQQVSLPGVGTTAHTVSITFAGNQIQISYDGAQVINTTDNSGPFISGGITLDMWTQTSGINTFDNISVTQ